MAETDRLDARVAQRYRALATEEPGPLLDAAIRASARRAVGAGPGERHASRWAVPASLAAVLVLAFGVTLRMQQEQPGLETALPERPAEAPKAAIVQSAPETTADTRAKTAASPAIVPARTATAPAPVSRQDAAPQPSPFPSAMPERKQEIAAAPAVRDMNIERRNEAPAALAKEKVGTALAPDPAPAVAAKRADAAGAAPAVASTEAVRGRGAPETPERKLERIAELRRAGRHSEADEALARFRREHPEFRIPPETWERVKAP